MAKNRLVIAMAESVTQLPWPCHLKVNIIQNSPNNIGIGLIVPKSVVLDVLHMYNFIV